MPDRDTVIKGLEYCESDDYCIGHVCPYFNKRRCIEELTHDALELLKAQANQQANQQADQQANEAATETQEYCERYEPTYNPEDGSL